MGQTVKLRRSAVSGKKPLNSQLELGELSANTTDGKLFFAKSGSNGPSVEEIITTDTVNTGSVEISGSFAVTGSITGTEFTGSALGLTDVPLALSGSDAADQSIDGTFTRIKFDDSTGIKISGTTGGDATVFLAGVASESEGSEGRTAKLEVTSATSTWTLNHNLNEKHPAIEVFDSNDEVIIPQKIEATSVNQVVVTFTSPQTGTLTATVGGGLPTIENGYGGRVLAVDGTGVATWKEAILSGSVDFSTLTDTGSFNTYTSSADGRLDSLETTSGSHDGRLDSLETTSGSHGGRLDSIETFTGSIDDTFATDADVTTLRNDLNTYTSSNDSTNTTQNSRLGSLETESGSIRSTFNSYTSSNNSTNTSQNSRLDSIEDFTASVDDTFATDADVTALRGDLNTYTSSNDSTNTTQNSRLSSLETNSGSQATSIGNLETFQSNVESGLQFTGSNVTIKGDLLVKGTETRVDSTTVDIADNIISLNGTGATNAGIEVRDTESPGVLSGSLIYDTGDNKWKGGIKGSELRLLDTDDLGVINVKTSSIDSRLSHLENESGSVRSDFNTYTSSNDSTNTSQNSRLSSLETKTGSLDTTNTNQNNRLESLESETGSISVTQTTQNNRLDSIETFTGSIDNTYATDSDVTTLRNDLNTYTSSNDTTNTSQNSRLGSLETKTGSLDTKNTTQDDRLDSIESFTGSLDATFASDADVTTLRNDLNTYTSSNDSVNTNQNTRLGALETESGSIRTDFNSHVGTFNSYTSSNDSTNTSQNSRLGSLETKTGSLDTTNTNQNNRLDSLETKSGSVDSTNTTQNSRLSSLETKTGSLDSTNTSQNSRLGSLETKTGSLDTNISTLGDRVTSVEEFTASIDDTFATDSDVTTLRGDFNTYTSSNDSTNTSQNSRLGSIESTTSSHDGRLDSLENTSSSHDSRLDTIEGGLQFTGSNVTVKGNLLVKGTETRVNSTTVDISDNIISLNGSGASSAGIEVRDTTSPGVLSGSLIWDGTNNQWKGGTKGSETRILLEGDKTTIDGRLGSLETTSGSHDGRLDSIESKTGSFLTDYNDEYTTGATFNSSNGIITFTRNDGDTFNVDIDGRFLTTYNDEYTTGATFNSSNGVVTFTRNDGDTFTVDLDGRYLTSVDGQSVTNPSAIFDNSGTPQLRTGITEQEIRTLIGLGSVENQALSTWTGEGGSLDNEYITNSKGYITGFTDTNIHTTGATFNTSNGVVTFTKNNSDTFTVDLDGKYAESGHNHDSTYLKLSGGTLTGGLNGTTGTFSGKGTFDNLELTSGNRHLTFTQSSDDWFIYNNQQNNGIVIYNGQGGVEIHYSGSSIADFDSTGIVFRENVSMAGSTTIDMGDNIITDTKVGQWDTAYGWGDHSQAGYLTSFTETDPVFTASAASGIESSDITNWNTAYGWGDHSLAGYLTAHPNVNAASSSNNSGRTYIQDILLDSNGHVTGLTTASESVVNTDEFTTGATFNSSNGVITFTRNDGDTFTVDIDGRFLTSFTESDPVFTASAASGIESSDITNWNTAYGWGDHSLVGYLTGFTETYTQHENINAASSSNNSGRTYIQDILLDSNGHVTGITTASESVVNTDEFTTGATFNSSNGVVTFTRNDGDTFTVDLDGRYLTSFTESDSLQSVTDRGSSTTNDITITNANTPKLIITDTTNNLSGQVRVANSYMYVNVDSSDSVNSTRLVFQTDGDTALYLNNNQQAYFSSDVDVSSGNIDMGTNIITDTKVGQWDTAYGWGNHASAGYLLESEYNDEYTTGVTFNGSNGILTFTRNDGDTYTVDISSTLTDVNVTGGTYNDGNQTLTLNKSDGNSINIQGFAIESVKFTTGSTFNTANGVITFTNNDNTTYTVDIDGRFMTQGLTLSNPDTIENGGNRYDPSTNSPTNEHYAIITYGNGGNVTGQLATHFQTGKLYSRGHNNSWSSWRAYWSDSDFTSSNITNWNTAYGWGDHSLAGYLTSYNNEYTTGATFNSSNGVVTFTRNDGDTFTVDLDGRYLTSFTETYTQHDNINAASSSDNSGRTYIQDILLDSNGHVTGITTASESVVNTDEFTTGATFNTSNGIITFTRNDGDTFTVDIDGKYAESGHNHDSTYLKLAGGTLTGRLTHTTDDLMRLYSSTNGVGVGIEFSDQGSRTQNGQIKYVHSDGASYGSGNAFIITGDQATMTILADGKLMYKEGIYSKPASGTGAGTRKDQNWDTAYGWGDHSAAGYLLESEYNDEYTTGATFNSSNGVVTFTRNDGDTYTVDLDGRYLTSFSESDTLSSVTSRGATTTSRITSGGLTVTSDIRGNGQQLVLNAGESSSYATGQTNEYVYVNAEQGLEVNTETGNWSGGWAARKTALLRGDQLTIDGETLTKTNIQNFKTAYGWGDHSQAGYLTSVPQHTQAASTITSGTFAAARFSTSTRYNIGFISGVGTESRDKIRVWDSSHYTIGMKSGYDFGHLGSGEFAMSFQMNDNPGRGWWWGHSSHTDDQGAASLTTDGELVLAKSLSIGQGESVTSPSSTPLYVEGTSAGSKVFTVQGTAGELFSVTDSLTGDLFEVSDVSGVPILTVNASGTVTVDETLNVTGDVTAYFSSDERLKDNVKPIENAIDKLKLINGYEFDWNSSSKNEGHDVGVIAQEVEKVLPEVVTTRSNGYKAVKYEKLTALLIQANKELLEKVEKLERKINDK